MNKKVDVMKILTNETIWARAKEQDDLDTTGPEPNQYYSGYVAGCQWARSYLEKYIRPFGREVFMVGEDDFSFRCSHCGDVVQMIRTPGENVIGVAGCRKCADSDRAVYEKAGQLLRQQFDAEMVRREEEATAGIILFALRWCDGDAFLVENVDRCVAAYKRSRKEQEGEKYKCAQCGGVFEKGWTDEDAEREREGNGWKSMPDSEMAVVCDDCYQKLFAEQEGDQQ